MRSSNTSSVTNIVTKNEINIYIFATFQHISTILGDFQDRLTDLQPDSQTAEVASII